MCFKAFRPAGLALAIFLAVSCAESIKLDPVEEMPVVATCVLTTETTEQSLNLFYAKRPSESGYVSIPDAKVMVREAASTGGAVHEFKWNGEKYVCPFSPRYDTRYLLEVETADGISLTAETTMPKRLSLLPRGHLLALDDYDSGALYEQHYSQNILFYFAHEADTDPEPYTDELYAWISAGARLSTNHKDADSFNLLPNNWNDLMLHPFFERRGRMAPEYYQFFSVFPAYLKFLRIHQQQGFSGTVSDKDLKFQWGDLQVDHLFYLNSDVVDDTVLTVEKSAINGISEERYEFLKKRHDLDYPAQNEFSVRFVSLEYDAYLKDLAEKTVVHADELSAIYSMEPTHSNIKGGLGIFGAEVVGRAPHYSKYRTVYIE